MVVGEVEAVQFLEGLPAGFEAGVGVQEGVEAGPVGFVELVASAQQREPGSEHFPRSLIIFKFVPATLNQKACLSQG